MSQTIGKQYHGPLYNWTDVCDYCGVPHHRHEMRLDADGYLRCPAETGLTIRELNEIGAANVGTIAPIRGKVREAP